ncbi:unnamed protein product, partial [marine sediment metagenome]
MAIIHGKYTKRGRIFIDTENLGRNIWKGAARQENVDIGNGDYVSYVWDSVNKRVKFANAEVRFELTAIEFWRDNVKLFEGGFYPEINTLGWQRKDSVVSGLAVNIIADSGKSKEQIEISYYVETDDQRTKVLFTVGGNGALQMGFEITAKEAGEGRIQA